jgi:uncharacterized protein YndB with AHSA1/START domain
MGEYTFTARIEAGPETVYDLFTDVHRMHEWTEGVSRISDEVGPAGQVGSSYTVWFGRMRSPSTILEAERPRRFRTRFGNRLLRGHSAVTLEADGDGTLLTETFVTEGLLPAIMARLWATGSYRGSFKGELASFKRIAEREARERRAEQAT